MAPCDSVFNLPIGFKFDPRDDELLGYYLLNKVRGTSFKFDNVVPEVDLYGRKEPWDIWEEYGGQRLEKGEDLYFFTKLKKVSETDSRTARTVGSGTWLGENSGTEVTDPKNEKRVLGLWKRFKYVNPKSNQDGSWIMHEFSLHASLVKPKANSTCDVNQIVLCRIRKNPNKRKLSGSKADHKLDDTLVQPQKKVQRPQQVTSFEELIGNCTPMSEATRFSGFYSQSQPTMASSSLPVRSDDRQFDDIDNDALMKEFSAFLDTYIDEEAAEQPLDLGSTATNYNEEKTTYIDENLNTQEGLSDNNVGYGMITEDQRGSQIGSEDSEFDVPHCSPDVLDSMKRGSLDVCNLIDFDDHDDGMQSFTAQSTGFYSQSQPTMASSLPARSDSLQPNDTDDDALMKDFSTFLEDYIDEDGAEQPLDFGSTAVHKEEKTTYIDKSTHNTQEGLNVPDLQLLDDDDDDRGARCPED